MFTRKKGNQCQKNYSPFPLLPICSKIFERLIYNELFTFFSDNNLNFPKQAGLFRSGDYSVNHLIAITKFISR